LAPWCETSHRQQMLLLAATGQQQEAFAQYERCRQILAEEYKADPLPATTLLYQQIKSKAWAEPAPQQLATWQRTLDCPPIRVNWEAVPQQPQLYGREDELNTLAHWLYSEQTPLIAVVGLPGQGKTALLAELVINMVEAVEDQASATSTRQHANALPANARFEQILWYSMAGASSFSHLAFPHMIADWLEQLAPPSATEPLGAAQGGQPATLERQLTLLLEILRKKRCLLILDQVEAIWEQGPQCSGYPPGYAPFGEFLRRLCTSKQASSVILLSRVELPELSHLRQRHSAVRVLSLKGIATAAGVDLLQRQGMSEEGEALHAVVEQVAGHPLALLEIADLCRTVGVRNPALLVANGRTVFGQLQHQLQQHLQQLTALEQELLIWLAYRREALAVETLWRHGPSARLRVPVVEALHTLQRRALVMLNRQADTVALPPVVLSHMTEQLVARLLAEIHQLCQQLGQVEHRSSVASQQIAHGRNGCAWEVADGTRVSALFQANGFTRGAHDIACPVGFSPQPGSFLLPPHRVALPQSMVNQLYLNRYPLIAPQATAAVQKEQRHGLVQPLVDHLHEQWGVGGTQTCLQDLLALIAALEPALDGHLAENIHHLLFIQNDETSF
ncbi:MAG: BTAD domain-containing putative transcriptional regulator, partial [Caldilineaceae bacterium]